MLRLPRRRRDQRDRGHGRQERKKEEVGALQESCPVPVTAVSAQMIKEGLIDPAVERAIVTRRSVRAFRPDPVPRPLIERLLEVASRAPSMTNTQPWRIRVLSGAALSRLTQALEAAHDKGEQWPAEYDYYPETWQPPYLERRRAVGWSMYGLLGIEKGDRAAAARQHGRNYLFFDAPVGMIVTMDRSLRTGSYLDLGMFVQNVMVAARGAGLDTCPQAAFAFMHPVIRRVLSIPEQELVVCGLALGFADESALVNRLEAARAGVAEFASFHDDDETS